METLFAPGTCNCTRHSLLTKQRERNNNGDPSRWNPNVIAARNQCGGLYRAAFSTTLRIVVAIQCNNMRHAEILCVDDTYTRSRNTFMTWGIFYLWWRKRDAIKWRSSARHFETMTKRERVWPNDRSRLFRWTMLCNVRITRDENSRRKIEESRTRRREMTSFAQPRSECSAVRQLRSRTSQGVHHACAHKNHYTTEI